MNILTKLKSLYEVIDYRNASTILQASNQHDFSELIEAFTSIRISRTDLTSSGGNESNIPKKFSTLLRPNGWKETQISGDLLVKLKEKNINTKGFTETDIKIENFLDGHKIDYVKNRIAVDLEWNSKDQTFDRDLYAFATFYQANIIDAAVLVTRSESLNTIFKELDIMKKYGASTTWMGKLDYRIKANRSGGCPVLVLGITPKLIES